MSSSQGQDTRPAKSRAAIVIPYIHRPSASLDDERSVASRAEEATGLALAIDLDIRGSLNAPLRTIRPSTLIGEGKLEELKALVEAEEIDIIIFDYALSPIQQRNLERETKAKVIDRTGLILEIFGERAQTAEGVLQVELAHLKYQKSRLVRSWTHLERQRGGFGFLGGPGETQIEADRRIITERISKLEGELETVRKRRGLQRSKRKKTPIPVVALVGYTNAGKSTLFNALTQSTVFAKDLLFATLDPTIRRLTLPGGQEIVLSDTVGFVADLPTDLVAAFRATLEEVLEADLILHVRDISHKDSGPQAADVREVLTALGINPNAPDRNIEVWNKIDNLPADEAEVLRATAQRQPGAITVIPVSALKMTGLDALVDLIASRIAITHEVLEITLDLSDGEGRSWLFRHGEVAEEALMEEEGVAIAHKLTVRFDPKWAEAARQRYGKKALVIEAPTEEHEASVPYQP